jgi:ubiquinone/menaquinone biosynthesis C-methylase UbiE
MNQADQQDYYNRTASNYDAMHLGETEHEIALAQLSGMVRYFRFTSLLDVGAGTGRVIRHGMEQMPETAITGIEPVENLRKIAYANGVSPDQLKEGNALELDFPDNSFDIVCAFGILHHIPAPRQAIAEMCRVARHGVFFSDLNNYGCGPTFQRIIAHALRILNLWRIFQWIKNGGKWEKFSEGDGVHYSYSLFDNLAEIRKKFPQIHLMNTKGSGANLLWSASHISVFAVKHNGPHDFSTAR